MLDFAQLRDMCYKPYNTELRTNDKTRIFKNIVEERIYKFLDLDIINYEMRDEHPS